MNDHSLSGADAAKRAGVTITVATSADLPDALRVQREGFGRVAARFGVDPTDMAPLRETLEDLQHLQAEGMRTFVARDGDTTAGTVRAEVRVDGVVEVGRLAVADCCLRRGVARALMLALEESYPSATRFELFTGAEMAEPLGLYGSLGYSVFSTESYGPWTRVWLAKERPGSATAGL